MTARESVEFAAAVRLPRGTPRDVQAARVDVVLQLMGLSEQQHMLVSSAVCQFVLGCMCVGCSLGC
jgi:ABC-type multidrug transport system ATPase subunit